MSRTSNTRTRSTVLSRRVSMPLYAILLMGVLILHNISLTIMLNRNFIVHSNHVATTPAIKGLRNGNGNGNDNGNGKVNNDLNPLLQDETNVAIPTNSDGSPMSLEDRLRYLELKTNSFIQFNTDPFFGSRDIANIKRDDHRKSCRKMSDLAEFGCKQSKCPGLYDHMVCLDNLPEPKLESEPVPESESEAQTIAIESTHTNIETTRPPPCLVYDFGVRSEPQFGMVMATTFGCEVHAFDPSPVSIQWWEGNSTTAKQLRESTPNYHFHPYGAGGIDGDITLKEYNWDQVSILHYPTYTVNCEGKGKDDTNCKLDYHKSKSFRVPVKTLPTIMKELGHDHDQQRRRTIDILKVDVEGSEYSFLQHLLDSTGGCPSFIQQITLEWHHFSWDTAYGEGSSPSINTIATLLHTCGLKNFWRHSEGGWPAPDKIYKDLDMKDVRYNLASFHRVVESDDNHEGE